MTNLETKKMADARAWISALRDSHDRLLAIVGGLAPEQLSGPSECSEWTIAQVLSHLGSGAEIFSLIIEAGLKDGKAPGPDLFPAIWDAWNAKSPTEQAADFKGADTALIEQLEALDEQQLADFKVAMFGMELDAAGVVGMRLSEHSLHTWDVAVALDPLAKVSETAVNLLIDELGPRVARAGKAVGGPLRVDIETFEPERSFVLSVGENVTLLPAPVEGAEGKEPARLAIPGEALIRLVSGRMDPDHTPAEVKAEGVSLDSLRAVFPGF
jgi:uncharacterized protein (TIGR03083 family)